MFFDHYQIAVNLGPETVIRDLKKFFDQSDSEPAKPHNGYEYCRDIVRGGTKLATVEWGGNTGENTKVTVSGSSRPHAFAAFAKEFWKGCFYVQRADVAIDFDEEKAFDIIQKLGRNVADEYGLKLSFLGDWERGTGRTLYLGSRQSPNYLRIYEKGHEQRQKGLIPDASENWVRVEFELKPKSKKAREQFSEMSPEQMLGGSQWVVDMVQCLTSSQVQRFTGMGTIKRKTADEVALRYMAKAYNKRWQSAINDLGGWDAFSAYLEVLYHEFTPDSREA